MPYSDLCNERIISEDYHDFIVNDIHTSFLSGISKENLCIQDAGFNYQCVYLPRIQAEPLTLTRFLYTSIPKCYAPMSLDTLNQAGILAIQNYPTLQLKGNGILIGFIDSGIDYENPIFRKLDGTTRIAAIWDQTIQSETPPGAFSYGTEYTQDQINDALRSESPSAVVPSKDETGHGTFTASLAAGGGNSEHAFLGAAPESTIAVVKLKQAKQYLRDYYFIPDDAVCYQETDIILGLRYLDLLAKQMNLPLVICLALGCNAGGHIGTLPLPSLMNQYAISSNRIPVTGTGNEADKRHHFLSNILNDSDMQTMEIRVGENVTGFSVELWTTLPNIVSISLTSPSGENTARIPIRAGSRTEFEFILERTRVSVDYRLTVELTTSELIYFRFSAPTPGIWRITVEPVRVIGGYFHAWLPVSDLLSGEVYFLQSNPDYTVTNPGNAANVIVSAYYDGNTDAVALSSGRGYTRNEQVNPSFAAPGINVTGALPGGRYASRSGSSIATAVSAGASALLLEWLINQIGTPAIDAAQIKSLLILGAVRPPGMKFPNTEWGYGKLNLYNTFEEIRQI